jgi:hypothetical protein
MVVSGREPTTKAERQQTERKKKMTNAAKVIEIIGEGFNLPQDISLQDLLLYVHFADESGEILKLLIEAGKRDIIERFKAEGIIKD